MSRKEKKVELTESQKFVLQLGAEVSTFMTIHKAAYFGQAKNIEKMIESKAPADAYDVEVSSSSSSSSSRGAETQRRAAEPERRLGRA